ncbi:hypothetical protein JMA_33760 [Jeotgalibacillus malaysiensis]|uniref:Uncharacterized protein n=1 Tax=Jeotgalibacillus malaysiensis TaxID=1508404 RepID=A0A0B5AVR2_9BACL|nr:paeninodin family lasso peptide [Jeotgalibacillus malaysiensis]AJD92693.1 hypothetical protein JMA_33760 [Jeotgalibacillus malaysiensis]
MKKKWTTISLESIEVDKTFAGPGKRIADEYQCDPDETVNYS